MDKFGRKEFFIDFSGYCKVLATDTETALETFWQMIVNDQPLPNGVYEIDGIEEDGEG